MVAAALERLATWRARGTRESEQIVRHGIEVLESGGLRKMGDEGTRLSQNLPYFPIFVLTRLSSPSSLGFSGTAHISFARYREARYCRCEFSTFFPDNPGSGLVTDILALWCSSSSSNALNSLSTNSQARRELKS